MKTQILFLQRENLRNPDLVTPLSQCQGKLLVTSWWLCGIVSLWPITPSPFQHLSPCLFCRVCSSCWWCYHLSAFLPGFLCLTYWQAPCHCAEIDITWRTSSLGDCWLWRLFHLPGSETYLVSGPTCSHSGFPIASLPLGSVWLRRPNRSQGEKIRWKRFSFIQLQGRCF